MVHTVLIKLDFEAYGYINDILYEDNNNEDK